MEFFDNHAHFDDKWFDEDRDEVIKATYDSGVTRVVSAGYSLEGSLAARELSKKYDFIYFTVGISPNDLSANWEQDVEKIEQILIEEADKLNPIEMEMKSLDDVPKKEYVKKYLL